MATKIQQVLESNPNLGVVFGDWLSQQGISQKGQYSYAKSGWLIRLSRGVYTIQNPQPTLLQTISAYNSQLGKMCVVGAYSALEIRGYSHYLPMGKPKAYLFTDTKNKLPVWMLQRDWDMNIKYMITSFLGDDEKGVEQMEVGGFPLLVSSPERAILECLHLPEAASSLLDIYYIMESLTTLRPKLVQELLEACTSQKVRRLFLYMAEKAGHPWYRALHLDAIPLGTWRCMVVSRGKYVAKYNMTIPSELESYE